MEKLYFTFSVGCVIVIYLCVCVYIYGYVVTGNKTFKISFYKIKLQKNNRKQWVYKLVYCRDLSK